MSDLQLRLFGDDVKDEMANPFHLHFSYGMIAWMTQLNTAVIFTTYTAGKGPLPEATSATAICPPDLSSRAHSLKTVVRSWM